VSKQYKVIGTCPVADVEPGGTVSQETLDAAGAKVEYLVGIHLEEVADKPTKTVKVTTE